MFAIYINDLADDDVIKSCKKLYADDSKLLAPIDPAPFPENEQLPLQADLDRIMKWCETWLMELNAEKCKVMHFGIRNPRHKYHVVKGGEKYTLVTTTVERDLGVLLSSDMRWTAQSEETAVKASRMLGLLKNTFRTRTERVWKSLCSTYVQPLLEFAVPAWSPVLERDARVLERVQRGATRIRHSL